MSVRAYFDWNATQPLRAEARAAVLAAIDSPGNASSVHGEGRMARKLMEQARASVAALVGADPKDVIFTSGATEANVLGLSPMAAKASRDRLLVSAVEHPSVLSGGRFVPDAISILPVDANGVLDRAALKAALAGAEAPLVSVMLANNETGVLQPIAGIADIVHQAGGLLHVDAVQGAGRLDLATAVGGADMVTLSSHKLGGPQGAGALIILGDVSVASPLITGGGQERGQRAGTENIAAIAGFGAAADVARTSCAADAARMSALRDRFEVQLKATTPDVVIFGELVARLPNTSLFALDGVKAETALIALDLGGFALSSGAACSSGKVSASHVLSAMGVDPTLARGALRMSLGPTTTEEEIDRLIAGWRNTVSSLLNRQSRTGMAA